MMQPMQGARRQTKDEREKTSEFENNILNIIEQGRKGKLSRSKIIAELKRQGFTEQEISNSLKHFS